MSNRVVAPLCAALSLTALDAALADPAPRPAPATAAILTQPPVVQPAPAKAPANTFAVAAPEADREAIKARLHDWVGGMIGRDPAAMGRLLAADFQSVTYGGALIDRAREIAALTAAPDFAVKAVTTKEVEVRLYGDAAVVRALAAVIELRAGKISTVPIRVTQTWIRQGGEWRIVADQATRADQPSP